MLNTTDKEGVRYIEHCKIIVNDDRLSLIRREDSLEKFFSIPYFNLSVLLLGEGTSITQKAAKFLAGQGVMLGFVGSGGTPLFMASQNEYRPTHYFNNYIRKWIDEDERLKLAKIFQEKRIEYLTLTWNDIFDSKYDSKIHTLSSEYLNEIAVAKDQNSILLSEAKFTKSLYKLLRNDYSPDFLRVHGQRKDYFNSNLDDGNYLAYGLASVALWTLGIPASMPVLHGKTRNGGFVFDIADIIKDGVILPHAFLAADTLISGTEFRGYCIEKLDKYKSMDYIFQTLSKVIL